MVHIILVWFVLQHEPYWSIVLPLLFGLSKISWQPPVADPRPGSGDAKILTSINNYYNIYMNV